MESARGAVRFANRGRFSSADAGAGAVRPTVAGSETGAARSATNFPSLRWPGGALDLRP